jgi:hypothetical protein
VALQLEVTHFVEVSIFVVELLEVGQIILAPTVILVFELPCLVCSVAGGELIICFYLWFCWHHLLRADKWFLSWLGCLLLWGILAFFVEVTQIQQFISVKI